MKKILAMCLGMMLLGLITPHFAWAQRGSYKVQGVVVDNTGMPIIGATVLEQGTTNGISTGLDGDYTLMVKDAQSVIEISYIGYKTVELVASSEALKNVTMEEDLQTLDEVVVIGYGTVKKNDMTGSVVAIKAEEMNRGAVVSTQDMLQGKVPGLQVVPGNGGPNSGATIRIRGMASLNASNNPLIVIDGVPVAEGGGAGMANPLSLVNANDIESFTVLKDASAAAIYGSRASNGVIIITTKKGKGNKVNVSYNGSVSVAQNSDVMPVMDPEQFRSYITTVYPADSEKGQAISKLMGNASTDWQDLIFRTAISHDHNVSVYGNYNDILPYRASVGYTGQQGTLDTSDYDRATIDVSLSPKFFDKHLTVSVNAKGVYTHQNYATDGAVGAAAFMNPTQDPYWRNADGSIDYTTTNGYWNWGSGRGTDFSPNNLADPGPLQLLYDQYSWAKVYRFLGNAQIDYKVHGLEALRFNLNLGMDWSKSDEQNGVNPGSYQAYKDTTIGEGMNYSARGWGQYHENMNLRRNHVLDFYANYNETWGMHNLDAMVGYSWQHVYGASQGFSFFNQTGDRNPNNKGLFSQWESFLVSFYGRINYSLNSKYLFTFTLRADGSSKFSKDNRWGYFPSAAFAWNIREENFLKNSDVVSNLKLRLGYGQTGQQEIGDYQYLSRYSLSQNVTDQYYMGSYGYSYFWSPAAYDPNIKWETTTTYNIGVDFGFLDGRIAGSVDVYRRDTKDLLNRVTTPLGANFGNSLMTNIGEMRNQGVEVSLDFTPVRTKDWNLRIGINGTYQNTEFIKLNSTGDENYFVDQGGLSKGTGGVGATIHQVGSKPYTYYLFQQLYDNNGNPIQNALVDRDGDGKISQNDRYNTGKSPLPDFFYGVNLKLSYKNWDFGFNGHGSIGNYAFNDFASSNSTANIDVNSGILSNYALTVLDTGWTAANSQEQWASDHFMENASFFRLDDVNLGYTFNKIGNTDLKIRVAAGVQNVFVITKYSGVDPEVSSSTGIDGTIWPRPRIYSLRVNVNF
ncbi:MAG: TonB-dependent receptor [Rikenellaceae bacterium]|nr:TonB-dependent receptor [Rikenellaceae bacterium]